MSRIVSASILTVLAQAVYPLHPVKSDQLPQLLESGYEYMLLPQQAIVVSIIRVNSDWHVILVEGEEFCPGFSGVLNTQGPVSETCHGFEFTLGTTPDDQDAVFVSKPDY